jgi:hypothetical protein
MRIWPLLVVFAGSPTLADDEPGVPRSRSFQALTVRLADRDIDDVATSFEGAALSLGTRLGAYTLYADGEIGYQHHSLDGFGAGVALHARRRICSFELVERSEAMGLPCWIDLGVGWSTLLTRDVTLSRPMISLGVGGGVEASSKRKRGGLTLGFAVELSPVTSAARRLELRSG